MITIDIQCQSCGGTGLYCGFAEPKGTAVVCITCGGSGKSTFAYEPFTGRKPRAGIHTVRLSGGSFIATGVGPRGASITYEEFKAGKLPQPRSPR
jgi:hypothetical protein